MEEGTIKTQNLNVVFTGVNRVYRLEIQSVMLVFSTPLMNCCPSTFSLTSPTPNPLPKVNVQCCKPYSPGVWGQHATFFGFKPKTPNRNTRKDDI